MATFPSVTLAKEFVKVRFLEPNAAEGINQRHLLMPRGVLLGFTPFVNPADLVLQLLPDVFQNFSMLKCGSTSERMHIDIFSADPILLDFTGHAQYPVYVLATADYQDGKATNGRIFTRTTPPTGVNEIMLCRVRRTGDDLEVDVDVPTYRQPPVAFTGQPYGFMPGGSVSDLASVATTVAEIAAARVDLTTTLQPTLQDRLAADMDGAAMASRLGLIPSQLLSNIYTVDSAASQVNVSGSFAGTSRVFAPNLTTIDAGGNETAPGVVTTPPRNLCYVVDADTGLRLVDTESPSVEEPTLDPVFGRLTYSTGAVTGTIIFTNAQTEVTSPNNAFASLQEGDIVLSHASDIDPATGQVRWYEVRTINSPTSAELATEFEGGGTGGALSVVNTTWRRFLLDLFSPAGAFSVPSDTQVQFTCPVFYATDQAVWDGAMYLKRVGEAPPVPDAEVNLAGKITLVQIGSLAGALRNAKSNGSPVGTNFHTINFTQPGTVVQSSPGVVDVQIPGAVGPTGAPDGAGPPGVGGINGPAYSTCNPFSDDTLKGGVATGNVAISFQEDFSLLSPAINTAVQMASGGFSYMSMLAQFGGSNCRAEINNIQIQTPNLTSAQLDAFLSQNGGANTYEVKVFLGAAE